MAQDRNALKVQALTQRIATLVAQYEDQLADLRAEATVLVENLQEQMEQKDNRINELEAEKANGLVQEDATDEPDSTEA